MSSTVGARAKQDFWASRRKVRPVITTIGDGAHRSLRKPLVGLRSERATSMRWGHEAFRATGAGREACRGGRHAGLVRLMVLR